LIEETAEDVKVGFPVGNALVEGAELGDFEDGDVVNGIFEGETVVEGRLVGKGEGMYDWGEGIKVGV